MRIAGAVLFACVLAVGACRTGAEPGEVGVEWTVSPGPPQTGPALLALTLTDAQGRPLRGADVRVEGNMTHPGMQPVHAEAREVAPGRYEAQLTFTMAGDWVVGITGVGADGRSFQEQVEVRGVRPAP